MGRTCYIDTFGCQMNKADSEAIVGLLEEQGYAKTSVPESADVVLLNTCAVRDHAEQKAYSYLGRYLKMKRSQPRKIIAFTGCVAQKEAEDLLDRFPGLDLVVGPKNFTNLPEYIEKVRVEERRLAATGGEADLVSSATPRNRHLNGEGRGWVSIMVGCDRFCSYCIVPYTREREECRSLADIESEVESLVDEGYREITLLGQSVTGYGRHSEEAPDFVDLLRRLDRIPGDFWLRFESPHPEDVDAQLIECFDELDHLAPRLHLPLQSGSSRVLKRMNRNYTREDYLWIVDQLRELETDVAVTTDAIVGFPGETEPDFRQTKELFEQVGFDKAFIFKFSPREGTPAADLDDQVDPDVIDRRHSELLELHEEMANRRNQRHVGRSYRVFVEGESPKSTEEDPQFAGRTGHGNVVVFPPVDREKVGDFIRVDVDRAESYTLFGSLPEESRACAEGLS